MSLLSYLGGIVEFITITPVHPVFFPFPWLTTLHAARIAHVYASRLAASGLRGQIARGPELAGFLVMCWGGGIFTNFLMFQPPPQVLSSYPWINYLSVYLLMDRFISFTPSLKAIDTALPLFDAILRSGAICGAVGMAHSHPNPAISSSLFFQLFIGAIASAAGGVTATTLGVFSPEWTFRAPPVLRGGFVDTLDVWSGSVAAAIYGCLMGLHPSYEPYTRWLSGQGEKYVAGTPLMSPMDARVVSILALTAFYAFRVQQTHYASSPNIPPPAAAIKEKAE